MNQAEFLEAVLPKNGCWYVVGIKPTWEKGEWNSSVPKGRPLHKRVTTVVEAVNEVKAFHENGFDVYYTTASFGQGQDKTGKNVVGKNELYIDLEAGSDKHYKTQEAARVAAKGFFKQAGLPMPTIVCSGRGFHLHWTFTETIAPALWKEVADALKRATVKVGFKIDLVCTGDVVRLLRVPETTNHKDESPVYVMHVAEPVAFNDIKAALLAFAPPTESETPFTIAGTNPNAGAVNSLTKALMDNQESSFELVAKKCNVIKFAIVNRATLEEPQWRFGISIAKFCNDAKWGIAEVSIDHPGYDEEATTKKAAAIPGPHSCEEAATLFPNTCEGCPHKGKIKSPIVLGKEVVADTTPPNTLVRTTSGEMYALPDIPMPYFRGKSGGIYRWLDKVGEEGEKLSELIYPHDLYVAQRMADPALGDVLMFRLHMPRDGTREFIVPQSDITSKEKCREAVTREGVALHTARQVEALQGYIVKAVIDMQYKSAANRMHHRFGWSKEDTFVLGEYEYTKNGPLHSPVTANLKTIAQNLSTKGTLEEWQTIANFYDKPSMEAQAFAFFCAFGAPLIHMSGLEGGYVNLYSNSSGTGKTTALKVMNSVYGNPVKLMLNVEDTQNAIMHRIGTMSSIAVGVDEITNATPERMSAFLYQSTQGRGKNRMESKGNEERQNNTDFTTIILSTSNASVLDKVRSIKQNPEGELARLLELHVPHPQGVTTQEAEETFAKLPFNYGHAGRIYLEFIVKNLLYVRQKYAQTAIDCDRILHFNPQDRFHKAVICSAFTGALIAKEIGLISIDVGRIQLWFAEVFESIRLSGTGKYTSDPASIVVDYVIENINNILVINDGPAKGNLMHQPIREPRISLTLRYEPDTDRLYLSKTHFSAWCIKKQINVAELERGMVGLGSSMYMTRKAMGKGSTYDIGTGAVYCVERANKILGNLHTGTVPE